MSDTGAVDPIRIPAWIREPAERWWREMPRLARIFVALAALDVVGRSIGFLSPAIQWSYLTPLGFVTSFVPHDLWILLPALLVIRRPDALTETPMILRGAILVAVVQVTREPVEAILAGTGGQSTPSVLAGAAAGVALAAGWVLLGRGLTVLTPRHPGQTVAGVATIAAILLGILAALYLAESLVTPAFDVGDPAYSQAVALSNLTGTIQLLGWAYLMWVVIRGLGDPRRPAIATNLAGAGALMAAFIVPLTSVLARLLGAVGVDLGGGSGFGELFQIVAWLGEVAGPTLVAAAFVLGLAEPPAPYLPPAAAAPPGPPPTRDEAPAAEPEEASEASEPGEPDEARKPAEAPSAPQGGVAILTE